LNIGDVVKIRTGGPQMTVNRRVDGKSTTTFWECVWFSGQWDAFSLNRADFAEEALITTSPLRTPEAAQ
jgi:uncharacterized protein YodC (DUF2158 family)